MQRLMRYASQIILSKYHKFVKFIFQAYSRNSEIVLSRGGYSHSQFSRVDYLWPLDTWRIYLVSGRPRKMPNFLTVIKPMDQTTWLLLTLSIPTMILSIFVIDRLYGKQRNTTLQNILHQSKLMG